MFIAKQYLELPEGCRVVSTESHGVSFWANTGRIDVDLADGTPESFFIKVISKESGKNMMHGEFESMSTIHALLPDVWISTSCEDAISMPILDLFPSLTRSRRFNTHVSALFTQNQALREHYEVLRPGPTRNAVADEKL